MLYLSMYMLVAVITLLVLPGPSCSNSDNIALLAGTLKTMQRAACDDEMVSLSCPRGTSISIQVAQYGKAAPGTHSCVPDTSPQDPDEERCLWPNSMQYSLLQTVVEACQKKPQCKFSTKSKPGLVDPCPKARKFVEVAFKCRPFEFRSLTGCEDDVIKLNCNPFSRVAIFDAQYGRTAYESITCPQTAGIRDETCKAPYAVETVMQICHGKRRCQIVANSKTFGSPCKPDSKAYLKVIYACVPLGVLTPRFESAAERDEIVGDNDIDRHEDLFDDSDGVGEKWGEPNSVMPNPENPVPLPGQEEEDEEITTKPPPEEKKGQTVHNYRKKVEIHKDEPKNNGNIYIYIISSAAVIIAVVVASIAARCYFVKRVASNSKSGDMFTTEAPNVFNDAVSDIDNDVDVSHISGTFYDTEHPDMILYRDVPGKGTIRAMRPLSTIYPCAGASMYGNVDYVPSQSTAPRFTRTKDDPEVMMSPKSLSGYTNSQFYYG